MSKRSETRLRRLEGGSETRFGKRFLSNIASLSRGQRASVSIEAAIAVPLMIIIVSSIMQLAVVAFAYVNMQDTVRDVAREVSVRRVGTAATGYNNTGFYTGACSAALSQPTNTAQYLACRKLSEFAGNYSVEVDAGDAIAGDTYVRVSVPIADLLFFNIGFLGSGATLTAEAKYVVEDDG